jgi:hypothetical protein
MIYPVCGTDGETYEHMCLAYAAGVEITSKGACGSTTEDPAVATDAASAEGATTEDPALAPDAASAEGATTEDPALSTDAASAEGATTEDPALATDAALAGDAASAEAAEGDTTSAGFRNTVFAASVMAALAL